MAIEYFNRSWINNYGSLNYFFEFQTSNGFRTDYFQTANFMLMFIIGSLLAKHSMELILFFRKTPIFFKYGIVISFFMLYNYSASAYGKILSPFIGRTFSNSIIELGITLGAAGFIIISLGSKRISRLLLSRVLLFFGKISYSLYLCHLPILLWTTNWLYNDVPLWIIFLVSTFLSIVMATLSWYFIENNSIKFGRFLSLKFTNYKNKRTKIKYSDVGA